MSAGTPLRSDLKRDSHRAPESRISTLPTGVSSYEEAIGFLYGLQSFGIKLGLHNIRFLLKKLGDPHRRFRVIHVAGTNGKGSTASMIAAILTAAGRKTALYTSPHLVDFTERMRVDGRAVSKESVVQWTHVLEADVQRISATFFETVTAMAFAWFAEERVDWAVVETGLGGRLDATNVVHPELTVLTSIGKEHTAILGRTFTAIAREKAGILKHSIPCICGVERRAAADVIRSTAKSLRAPIRWSTAGRVVLRRQDIEHVHLDVDGPYGRWKNLEVGLGGKYQIKNVRLALLAVHVLNARKALSIPESAVRTGLRRVKELSGIRGRMSVVHRQPRILVDVAHNPDAMRELAAALRAMDLKRLHVVFGVARDKDVRSMARALKPCIVDVMIVAARTPRSVPAEELLAIFHSMGIDATVARSVEDAVRTLRDGSDPTSTILVTGSHFVAGEAVAFLEGREYLTISQ